MKIPRPFQIDCINASHQAFAKNRSALAVVPTGGGKTFVVASIMSQWTQGSCLFLAHTQELVEQNAAALAAEMDGRSPIIEMNVRGADLQTARQKNLIVVGSVQSMCTDRRLAKYANNPFSLIAFDEAHRAAAPSFRKIADYFIERNPNCKIFGITATPSRSDETSLGTVFETVAYQISIGQLINDGWLVPIEQKAITIEDLDFSNLRTKKNEFGERDFSPEQLEKIINEEKNLQAFAKAIIEESAERPTLAFTPGVQSAHLLASILNRYDPNSSYAVDGETPTELRRDIFDKFRRGQIKRLTNCNLAVEGFDAPICSCLAMCKPTKSLGRYIQALGRGLRPLAGLVDGLATADERRAAIAASAKPNCKVLDFAGVSEHKLVDVWDALGGNDYDPEVVALASREAPGKNITEELEKAKYLRLLRMRWEERQAIIAKSVQYQSHDVNPFGGPSPVQPPVRHERGTITDKQLALLVSLGVSEQTAMKYSKGQAGAVIQSVGAKRCTFKQAARLQEFDIPTEGVNMDKATELIDAIKDAGWQRLPHDLVRTILEN